MMVTDLKDAPVTGGFRGLDHEKVLGTCGWCGHQWKVKKYRITWAEQGKYKLACNACRMRLSAAAHTGAARELIQKANEIDARRRARKAKKGAP